MDELDGALAARLIADAPVALLTLDPSGAIEHANQRLQALLGRPLAELRGREWLTACVSAPARELLGPPLLAALAAGEPFTQVAPLIAATGEARLIEWSFRPLAGAGAPRLHVGVGQDLTDAGARVDGPGLAGDLTLRALRQRERQLREAQEIAKIGSWTLDLRDDRLVWSDEIYRIFEIDPAEFGASYEAFLAAVHPDDRAALHDAFRRSVVERQPYEFVHRLRFADGRIKYVREIGRSDYDDDGAPIRSVGTVQDISDRVAAEHALQRALADKEMLLREIHHRVKNNLQIISSLLHFQAKRATTPADVAAFAQGRDRLLAMILVHEKLYQSHDLSQIALDDYLRALGSGLLASIGQPDRLRVAFAVEPLDLPIEVALPIGMILCELLTNAFKHATAPGRPCAVRVEARRVGGDLVLRVEDDGPGLPAGFTPGRVDTFGWRLVRSLALQLDAEVTILPGDGARVRLTAPLPDPVDRGLASPVPEVRL